MRYVSEIHDKDGNSVSVGRRIFGIVEGAHLTVCATDTGELIENYYGEFCIGMSNLLDIAIVHSNKTAKLHDFIIRTESRRSPSADGNASYYKSIQELLEEPNENVMLVAVPDEIIEIFGEKGSVIRRINSNAAGEISYCTLYDLLVDLCRNIGDSVMSKPVLLLECGGLMPERVVIEFDQSEEAQKFFLKMLIESV